MNLKIIVNTEPIKHEREVHELVKLLVPDRHPFSICHFAYPVPVQHFTKTGLGIMFISILEYKHEDIEE